MGRHHHVLDQPRLLGRPRSLARHSLLSHALLLTRHPPRRPVILRQVGNLSCASLPSRHPAGPITLWRRPVPWSRAMQLGVPHPLKIGHVVPPSCFVDRQWMTLYTSRNKRRFMSNVTWKKAHSCDRLTSEVSSHQLTSFLASKMPGKGHWDSVCQIHICTRARRKSKLQGDMVLCAGAAACRVERGLNFVVWNFAWDWLASRLYAATATTFLMKFTILDIWRNFKEFVFWILVQDCSNSTAAKELPLLRFRRLQMWHQLFMEQSVN